MTFVGVWACQRRELQPITFGLGLGLGGGSDNNSGDGAAHSGNAGEPSTDSLAQGEEDLESGFASLSRGRGRGRNRDGGAEYEMVPMKEAEGHTA